MGQKIILASKSPRRKQILKQIGYDLVIRVSNTDESIIKEDNPGKLVMKLSRLKADDVARTCKKGDVIVAADTVVALDGKILGKPHSKKEADEMLHIISGRTHTVFTGVTIVLKGGSDEKDKVKTFYESSKVKVGALNQTEIDKYISSGEPMDKAGAYGIQGEFAKHIKGITGDFYNVMGLPAHKTYENIKEILGEG